MLNAIESPVSIDKLLTPHNKLIVNAQILNEYDSVERQQLYDQTLDSLVAFHIKQPVDDLYLRFGNISLWSQRNTIIGLAKIRECFAKALDSGASFIIVGNKNKDLVSVASIAKRNDYFCDLGVLTDKDHQDQNFGSIAVLHALHYARNNNMLNFRVDVSVNNIKIIKFCRRIGITSHPSQIGDHLDYHERQIDFSVQNQPLSQILDDFHSALEHQVLS
jgi:hypothetical protein